MTPGTLDLCRTLGSGGARVDKGVDEGVDEGETCEDGDT